MSERPWNAVKPSIEDWEGDEKAGVDGRSARMTAASQLRVALCDPGLFAFDGAPYYGDDSHVSP